MSATPEHHPPRPPAGLHALTSLIGLAVVGFLSYLVWSQEPTAVKRADSQSLAAPPQLGPCLMDREGYLVGQMFGAIPLHMDWQGTSLSCDGNARPSDRGLRLFFAGTPGGEAERLVLVLGIDSTLDVLAGAEHNVNFTLIDEGRSRFYNSGKDRCWTRVHDLVPLTGDAANSYRVDGQLYCAGAIPSLSDQGSVTLGSVSYSGRLTLGRR
jgi:hypothetical protein